MDDNEGFDPEKLFNKDISDAKKTAFALDVMRKSVFGMYDTLADIDDNEAILIVSDLLESTNGTNLIRLYTYWRKQWRENKEATK